VRLERRAAADEKRKETFPPPPSGPKTPAKPEGENPEERIGGRLGGGEKGGRPRRGASRDFASVFGPERRELVSWRIKKGKVTSSRMMGDSTGGEGQANRQVEAEILLFHPSRYGFIKKMHGMRTRRNGKTGRRGKTSLGQASRRKQR